MPMSTVIENSSYDTDQSHLASNMVPSTMLHGYGIIPARVKVLGKEYRMSKSVQPSDPIPLGDPSTSPKSPTPPARDRMRW